MSYKSGVATKNNSDKNGTTYKFYSSGYSVDFALYRAIFCNRHFAQF